MQNLCDWKKSTNRKPLLLYGERQVGKTYLVKEFGNNYYQNLIYVNFETNKIVSNMINEDITPQSIIKNLEVVFNQRIEKENTLIFFDEIQENPRALTSLKYFYEDAPEYHIIGAGSLLGVHIKRDNYSFPVGKVDILTIEPLSFDEFLMNTGQELLIEEIKKSYQTNQKLPDLLHREALKKYRDYLSIGGMPEVVKEYKNTNSLVGAIDIQSKIIDSYRNDITKYTIPTDANKIIATFNSIPNQLAKENKKFQYKIIQKGGTSSIFGDSIIWLENAGIANKCYKTKIGIPLKMYEELDSFKLYMNDVGLLTFLSEFPIYLIQNQESANEVMIGMLTENYVASALKYNHLTLHYWQKDTSEIDFILQSKKGKIIPVEVKANDHTKSRSLSNYQTEYHPEYSIRISTKNFEMNNNIKSVPLYAVFCITDDSLDK